MRRALGTRSTAVWLSFLASVAPTRAGHAQAQPTTRAEAHGGFHLSWVRSPAAAGCPDAGRMMLEVANRLGVSPFGADAPALGSVEVRVERDQGYWYALISLRDSADVLIGSRRVQSNAETCDSLAAATVLAIALMMQPSLESDKPDPTAARATRERDSPPVARPMAPPPTRSPASAAAGVTPLVRIGASTIAGALPYPSAGPTLRAGLRFGSRFVLLAGAHYFPQQWMAVESVGLGLSLSLASLSGCWRFPLGAAVELSSCTLVLGGAVHVAVDAERPVAPGDDPWLGAGLGLMLSTRTGSVELGVDLAAVGHVQRRDYRIQRSERSAVTAFVEPALAGLASLTLGTLP
jgi:hypothetical protein